MDNQHSAETTDILIVGIGICHLTRVAIMSQAKHSLSCPQVEQKDHSSRRRYLVVGKCTLRPGPAWHFRRYRQGRTGLAENAYLPQYN